MNGSGVRFPAIRRIWLVAGTIVLMPLAWGAWIISDADNQAHHALADSLPGFTCNDMLVDIGKLTRGWHGAIHASASITMPATCRAEFERHVRLRFSPETCNGVEPCWKRSREDTVLTLRPEADFIHYTFEKAAPER